MELCSMLSIDVRYNVHKRSAFLYLQMQILYIARRCYIQPFTYLRNMQKPQRRMVHWQHV